MSSCDTFLAMPPACELGVVIFGKNSDRPASEVQEVVYYPSTDNDENCLVQCTYIEIKQISHTYAVILSKPAWMWGAEMGANENGVCIGNEAVFTKHLNLETDNTKRLLGMDFVRLGLERSKTASEGIEVITTLLELHGQGGPCYEDISQNNLQYHNSFIIADPKEAYVLETSGKFWACSKINSGTRNISNLLSIQEDIFKCSHDLKEEARKQNWWSDNEKTFNFSKVFGAKAPCGLKFSPSENPESRYLAGNSLLLKFSEIEGKFDMQKMMKILRDKTAGICRVSSKQSVTTASQISVLKCNRETGMLECIHYFTATPNPLLSIFKPFTFGKNITIGTKTTSPIGEKTSFGKLPDRRHELYKSQERFKPLICNEEDSVNIGGVARVDVDFMSTQIRLERELVNLKWPLIDNVFKEAVEMEMLLYDCIELSDDECVGFSNESYSSFSNIIKTVSQLSLIRE